MIIKGIELTEQNRRVIYTWKLNIINFQEYALYIQSNSFETIIISLFNNLLIFELKELCKICNHLISNFFPHYRYRKLSSPYSLNNYHISLLQFIMQNYLISLFLQSIFPFLECLHQVINCSTYSFFKQQIRVLQLHSILVIEFSNLFRWSVLLDCLNIIFNNGKQCRSFIHLLNRYQILLYYYYLYYQMILQTIKHFYQHNIELIFRIIQISHRDSPCNSRYIQIHILFQNITGYNMQQNKYNIAKKLTNCGQYILFGICICLQFANELYRRLFTVILLYYWNSQILFLQTANNTEQYIQETKTRMNKSLTFVAITLLLAVLTSSQGCVGFYGGDLIQSGKYAIVNSHQEGYSFTYTTQLSFTIPKTGVQIAVTTSTLANYNPLPDFGYNYFISGQRIAGKNAVEFELLILADNSWGSIQLGYIFNGRTDLAVGNIQFDYQKLEQLGDGLMKGTTKIAETLPEANYQVAVFISGYSIYVQKYSLSINQKYYEKQKRQLGIVFHISTTSILSIAFSYVIYPSVHTIFSFNYDKTPDGDESYQLSGPVDYSAKNIRYEEWKIQNRVLSCWGGACASSCLRSQECLKSFGNIWEGRCVICGPGVIFQKGICTRNCGANQFYFRGVCLCPPDHVRIGTDCTKKEECGPNQEKVNGKCICNDGYALWQDVCRKCPAGAKLTADRNSCECESDFTYNKVDNTCVRKCQTNQNWINDRCVCKDGWISWNKSCRQCPTNSAPNQEKSACVCKDSNHIYFSSDNQCRNCPSTMSPNSAKTGCECPKNTKNQNGVCVSDCGLNKIYVKGQCECAFGFLDIGGTCVQRCGLNQKWNGKQCNCKEGYALYNGVCRECPTGTNTNADQTWCMCQKSNEIFISTRSVCEPCPVNSVPNAAKKDCDCSKGYTNQAGVCVKQSSCPPRSTFDQKSLACKCTAADENLIDGICQKCPGKQQWNGKQCVCISKQYRIDGVCRTCDPKSTYNGRDCVCNTGFYGNRDSCKQCHASCSKCSGPEASQCLACADITLILNAGFCTQGGVCPIGSYLAGSSCRQCLPYCRSCKGELDCQVCAPGFELSSFAFGGQTINNCEQICGDGRRFEHDCDDNNTKNGDGCNSNCQIESGWTCVGGTSIKKDSCSNFIPGTYIQTKGSVNIGNKVIQSVRATYLPTCMTDNKCAKCFDALEVRVLQSLVPITVTVSYVPQSKYQFYVEYFFPGLTVTSAFKVSIRLNRDYNSCFRSDDYNQVIDQIIDPAVLKCPDFTPTLSTVNNITPKEVPERCFK